MSFRSFVRAHKCRRILPTPAHVVVLRYGSHRWIQTAATAHDQSDPSLIRNIALLAHIDSGKTTLTESILHASGHLSAPGTVDTGSTTTDFLPAERERGITIQSASIPVRWKEWSFNLVDTPGHADFGMEVESASSVVDGAVVLIDAVEGVEGQTKGVWAQLDRNGVATRLVYLNKLDRVGASLRGSLLSLLAHKLHRTPLLVTLPLASSSAAHYARAEPGIQGVVDLVNLECWYWPAGEETRSDNSQRVALDPEKLVEGKVGEPLEDPDHPLLEEILPARTRLVEVLIDGDEKLMDELLALPDDSAISPYLRLPGKSIMAALRAATLSGKVLPVLGGSAFRHIGTELLMDFVGELLASPVDVLRLGMAREAEEAALAAAASAAGAGAGAGKAGKEGKGGKAVVQVSGKEREAMEVRGKDVRAMAWKVGWDRQKGWMTFVRVYAGTLNRGAVLWNSATGEKERAQKLMLVYADQSVEVDSLPFGSIGVVLGLKHTRTGDTLLSSLRTRSTLRSITPPPSVISASVIPDTRNDMIPVQQALAALARTDPSVRVSEDEAEAQTLVHGLGALHLEIVEGRLRDEWGVGCSFGRRRVSYREGFFALEEESVEEHWQRDAGGKRVGARVSLTVRSIQESSGEQPHPAWGGNAVLHNKEPLPPAIYESSSLDPLFHIAQGLQTALSGSPHSSLPVIGLHITVKSFKLDYGSPPSVAASAAAYALRRVLQAAGPGEIREPFMRVSVHVAEADVGRIVKDFGEKGGEVRDLAGGFSASADGEDGEAYSSEGIYVPPAILTPSATPGLESHAGPGMTMKRTVQAIAPLSKLLDYNSRLRALSGGQATFEMSAEGFRTVGEARRLEILKEIGRA